MSELASNPNAIDLLPPFPEVIDSSMRSAFVSCPRQWYYSYHLGLRKPGPSIHLHFGGCVAKGIEVTRRSFYAEHKTEVEAVSNGCKALIKAWGDFEVPTDIQHTRAGVKTLDAALDALVSYFEYFQLSNDHVKPLMLAGEAMIEKSFALPIPGTSHPITGNPIIYAGRFDMIGDFNEAIFIVDEKTTLALGTTWASNWPLRGQLTGYCWGGRSFGLDIAGCIIRGLGILKQSIQFQQAILTRPKWMIDAWLRQLSRDVNRMREMWIRANNDVLQGILMPHLAFDQAFDSACSAYGGCGFVPLCEAQDPRHWYGDYVQHHWNPLQRDGDSA